MAQGTVTCFNEFAEYIGDGSHDLDTDAFKIMLITNATVPTSTTATPDSADFTEVSGTGYTAGGGTATLTWTRSGGVATLALSANVAWTQNAAGPTNIYYGILYNTSHVGTTDAVAFIDMTADGGTTPISLVDGDITINLGNIFTLTI